MNPEGDEVKRYKSLKCLIDRFRRDVGAGGTVLLGFFSVVWVYIALNFGSK